ncbi:flagella basal body P-ring formation protein FlgA [Aurantiacibacter suaedae]|uniref:flagella basal body P-ring formation protein FlgA n=1 Tax=Aurantiacibacter suaedae TaxID=2545755 RepID=UPI0010F4ECFF|nr:flagella basal body P-ring formation protein FlgA [Aurantiacibacter suaedae]
MRRLALIAAAAPLAALAAAPAAASQFHDLAAIDGAVAQFAGAQIGQSGGAQTPVDRQMRLAECAAPLALDWYGAGETAVRVTCPGSWRIFVPIMRTAASVSAAEQAPVVSRRDLLRVEAGGAGFRVSRSGEALEEGQVGEAIRVKIDDGTRQGRVVTARVVEAGLVRVAVR